MEIAMKKKLIAALALSALGAEAKVVWKPF